jgi:hypothetical protein
MLLKKDSADEFKHKMRNHTTMLVGRIDDLETRYYENCVRGICANQGLGEDQYLLRRLRAESLDSDVRQARQELKQLQQQKPAVLVVADTLQMFRGHGGGSSMLGSAPRFQGVWGGPP